MKVHRITFAEMNQPGSIWPAVDMAKQAHREALEYRRAKLSALFTYCLSQRGLMMQTVRVIARGLHACIERDNRRNALTTDAAARKSQQEGE
jgi:hypothetical protein